MMPKQKGTIVAASMAAGSGARLGAGHLSGKAIEAAMNQATLDALAKGIVDPDDILKLKLTARERVKSEHRAAVERAEKAAKKAEKATKR